MTRYLFLATLGTGLFWLLYRWLLRRERCLRLNRAFLLLTLALSMALPLWRLQVDLPTVAVGGAGAIGLTCRKVGGTLPMGQGVRRLNPPRLRLMVGAHGVWQGWCIGLGWRRVH